MSVLKSLPTGSTRQKIEFIADEMDKRLPATHMSLLPGHPLVGTGCVLKDSGGAPGLVSNAQTYRRDLCPYEAVGPLSPFDSPFAKLLEGSGMSGKYDFLMLPDGVFSEVTHMDVSLEVNISFYSTAGYSNTTAVIAVNYYRPDGSLYGTDTLPVGLNGNECGMNVRFRRCLPRSYTIGLGLAGKSGNYSMSDTVKYHVTMNVNAVYKHPSYAEWSW
ncbi:hypothetical protein [Photobacterium salinisoli]|uniref:hypothetical protein n=1 Tax=Photobacterium salinisoli TaxID=1616783 RepID=UPI000EA18647|nr:hypothetical protein [Photobacterium salinisoli]